MMEWVVIANRSGADIYKHTDRGSIKLLEEMPNPLGRLKSKEMQDDQPGVSRGKFAKGTPYNLSSEHDPHEDAAFQFVKKLVKHLQDEWNKDHKLTFKIVAEAKNSAKEEGDRIIESAREVIKNEKMAAVTELKNQVAVLSIEIAEKIVKEKLSTDEKQKALVDGLVKEINLN